MGKERNIKTTHTARNLGFILDLLRIDMRSVKILLFPHS